MAVWCSLASGSLKGAACEVTSFMADAPCLPSEGGGDLLALPVWRA